MFTLLLLLLAIHSQVSSASTFQNLTDAQSTAPWSSSPSGRGTLNIIYNSAGTLALCVWNSVHLNIPAVREKESATYRRQIKWVIIALLAPKLLVFTTFQQYLAARKFLRELRTAYAELPPEVSTRVMF